MQRKMVSTKQRVLLVPSLSSFLSLFLDNLDDILVIEKMVDAHSLRRELGRSAPHDRVPKQQL